MADKQPTKITQELGVSGLNQYNGNITESWISDLRTNARKVEVFDEMSRLDAVGAAMLQTTSIFMQGAKVHVRPAGNLPEDKEKAEFLERALQTMQKPFEDVMSDISHFLVYGWFAQEVVYERRDDKRIYWKKWSPRHPITLDRWEIKDGDMAGMWQDWDGTSVFIPAEKMLHFTTSGSGKNNFEGVSVYEGSYTSWFYVKNLQILEAIVCERMSGTPVMMLPDNVDFTDTSATSPVTVAKNIVRNVKIGEDMGMTLPSGWTFKYEMPAHGPAIELGEVIARHQKDFARVMLMDFIMLGAGDGGSFAMIKDKSAMYLAALNTFLSRIAATINRQAVKRLFDLNSFPEGSGTPTVFFDKLAKVDMQDFSEMVSRLFNAGTVTYDLETENQVRRTIGLDQIEKPGLLLKPNLPAQQGVTTPDAQPQQDTTEDVSMPASQEVEEGEAETDEAVTEKKMSEFADLPTAQSADAMTDATARKLTSIYLRTLKPLSKELTAKNEKEWESLVAIYTNNLVDAMRESLMDDAIKMWRDVVGDAPNAPQMMAILDEIMLQYGYMTSVLTPAIRDKILEVARQAKEDDMAAELFALAISGATGLFAARAGTYASAIYKIFANKATPVKAKKTFDTLFPRNTLTVDLKSGILTGDDNLLARNVSVQDNRVCPDCSALSDLGWTKPENLQPQIGDRMCKHNDRCFIQYKYRGRVA